MMQAATYQPTETELKAYQRRQAFRKSIADKAAELAESKKPREVAPEAVPAQPDPPADEVVTIEAAARPAKAPFFFVLEDRPVSPLRISGIQDVVCEAYGVGLVELTSHRRHARVVRPRMVAMYLAKVMTGRSLPEVGRKFGGRDHTTVLHAVRKITAKVEFNAAAPELFDPELSQLVALLRSEIEARHG